MLAILLMSKESKVYSVWSDLWPLQDLDLCNHTIQYYVEGVESYFDFWPFQRASTYIALDGMVEKP